MNCIHSDHPENGHADNTLFYWGKVCWSLLINTSPESSHQHTTESKCQTQDAAVTSSRFVRGRLTEIQYFLIEQKKFEKKKRNNHQLLYIKHLRYKHVHLCLVALLNQNSVRMKKCFMYSSIDSSCNQHGWHLNV